MGYELRRRLVHASGSMIPGLYLLDRTLEIGFFTWNVVRIVAIVGVILAGVLEILRLYAGLEWNIFEQLTREYERDSVAGYALYVLSATVVILLFEPPIAIPAVFMLTLGDPISGLVASGEFRTVKRPQVLVIMFGVCFVIAYPFVSPIVAIAGALGGTIADGVKPVVAGYVIDDNLTIPVLAAGAMWLVIKLV